MGTRAGATGTRGGDQGWGGWFGDAKGEGGAGSWREDGRGLWVVVRVRAVRVMVMVVVAWWWLWWRRSWSWRDLVEIIQMNVGANVACPVAVRTVLTVTGERPAVANRRLLVLGDRCAPAAMRDYRA